LYAKILKTAESQGLSFNAYVKSVLAQKV
jgi:predicted HicB family RNase H-like nuclease